MNKKGIFFTLIVIAIISLFLVGYTFYKNYGERSATYYRINTLNTFIFSIEKNLERQLFISGFRSLFIMQTESLQHGAYITNATASFNELFFNGTFNNKNQSVIMTGATFSDIQTEIQRIANKVNTVIILSNPSIYLNQTDPWNIDLVFNINLYAKDKGNLAMWNKTQTYISKVPIEDFEDPIYLLNTGGVVSNKITKTPFINLVSGADVTNLTNHTLSGYYLESDKAPNYLNRLQGINLADENGIESLVNIPKLSNQKITTYDKSVIDHVYFSTNNPISCKITGMSSWFKIDQSRLLDYQLIGLADC